MAGRLHFPTGSRVTGLHEVLVLIRLSNLVNCLPNIKAECRTRARSAQLSLLHSPSLSELIFSSNAGRRRNGGRPQ